MAERPNVLFIIRDDLNDALEGLGDSRPLPAMDRRLARASLPYATTVGGKRAIAMDRRTFSITSGMYRNGRIAQAMLRQRRSRPG
jgi:hypothetical protein